MLPEHSRALINDARQLRKVVLPPYPNQRTRVRFPKKESDSLETIEPKSCTSSWRGPFYIMAETGLDSLCECEPVFGAMQKNHQSSERQGSRVEVRIRRSQHLGLLNTSRVVVLVTQRVDALGATVLARVQALLKRVHPRVSL